MPECPDTPPLAAANIQAGAVRAATTSAMALWHRSHIELDEETRRTNFLRRELEVVSPSKSALAHASPACVEITAIRFSGHTPTRIGNVGSGEKSQSAGENSKNRIR